MGTPPIHYKLNVLSSYKENGVRMAYTYTHVYLYSYTFGGVPPFKCQSQQPRWFIFIYYFICGIIIHLPNRILGTSPYPLTFCLRVSI